MSEGDSPPGTNPNAAEFQSFARLLAQSTLAAAGGQETGPMRDQPEGTTSNGNGMGSAHRRAGNDPEAGPSGLCQPPRGRKRKSSGGRRKRSRSRSRSSTSRSSSSNSSFSSTTSSSSEDRKGKGNKKARKRQRKVRRVRHATNQIGGRRFRFPSNEEQKDFNEQMLKAFRKIKRKAKSKSVAREAERAIGELGKRNKAVVLADQFGYGIAKQMKTGSDLGLTKKEQDQLKLILMEKQLVQTHGFPSGNSTRTDQRSSGPGQQRQPFRQERGSGPRFPNSRRDGENPARRIGNPGPKPTDICRLCNQPGHWASSCPQKPPDDTN